MHRSLIHFVHPAVVSGDGFIVSTYGSTECLCQVVEERGTFRLYEREKSREGGREGDEWISGRNRAGARFKSLSASGDLQGVIVLCYVISVHTLGLPHPHAKVKEMFPLQR